jgi:hypothetical protein
VKSRNNLRNGPVMSAAKAALETGNANYILIWIPEESENTLKNLLERACCARITRNDAHDRTADWFFETVNRLHIAYHGPHNLSISTKTPEEKKIILLVDAACESGNFDEINAVIPDTPAGEMRQRFNDMMKKRNYDWEKNCAAGRVYVSAFIDFITFVYHLHSVSSGHHVI